VIFFCNWCGREECWTTLEEQAAIDERHGPGKCDERPDEFGGEEEDE